MRAANVAIIAAAGGVAFVLARWSPSAPAPAPVEQQVRTVTRPEIVYVDRTVPAPARGEQRAEPAPVEPTPEHETAVATIERAVTTALATRRWREEDRRLVRAQTGYIEAEQLVETMRPLVVAVNHQEVEVELVGALY